MKRFIAFFLLIALLTNSLLVSVGLSSKYVMRPFEYVERLKTVIENAPTDKTEEVTFWEDTELQYYDLGIKLPTWNPVSIDNITEIPKALGVFMNRSMTFLGAVVKELFSVFPKMFANLKIAFRHYLGPIPKFIVYVGRSIKNAITTKYYIKVVCISLIPLDWLEMKQDEVKLRLPWFGAPLGLPLEIYYGIRDNIDGEEPEEDNGNDNTDVGGNTSGDDDDFTIDIYDPNYNPDPDFVIPDTGGDNGGNDFDIGQT